MKDFDAAVLRAPDGEALMQALVALGGEVFVLRAEFEALRRACQADPGISDRIQAVRADPAYETWLREEETAFARHLLGPIGARP